MPTHAASATPGQTTSLHLGAPLPQLRQRNQPVRRPGNLLGEPDGWGGHGLVAGFSRPIGNQIPVILDGYRRVDNFTDATLASYREHYGDAGITKEDIFFYVYALLHHPEYRERYEDDLKKMLPHIPRAAGFHTYASVGRELADLHVNYERLEPYPSVQEEASLHAPADPWERYRIGERKMRFPALGRRDKDFTRLEYNDYVTLTGIPAEAQGYSISGRSPLEWIIDR